MWQLLVQLGLEHGTPLDLRLRRAWAARCSPNAAPMHDVASRYARKSLGRLLPNGRYLPLEMLGMQGGFDACIR